MKKIKNFKDYIDSLNENITDMNYLLDKISYLKQRGIDNWREHLTQIELDYLDNYHVSMKLPSREKKSTLPEEEYIQKFIDSTHKFEIYVISIEKDLSDLENEYKAILIYDGDKYEGVIKHYLDSEQIEWNFKIPDTDIIFDAGDEDLYYEFDDLAQEVVEHFEIENDKEE